MANEAIACRRTPNDGVAIPGPTGRLHKSLETGDVPRWECLYGYTATQRGIHVFTLAEGVVLENLPFADLFPLAHQLPSSRKNQCCLHSQFEQVPE
jgi:hypothetical protein